MDNELYTAPLPSEPRSTRQGNPVLHGTGAVPPSMDSDREIQPPADDGQVSIPRTGSWGAPESNGTASPDTHSRDGTDFAARPRPTRSPSGSAPTPRRRHDRASCSSCSGPANYRPARSPAPSASSEPGEGRPGRTPQPGRRATTHARGDHRHHRRHPGAPHHRRMLPDTHPHGRQRGMAGRVRPLPAPVLNRPSPRVLCAWSPGKLRCAACAHATQQQVRSTVKPHAYTVHAISPIHPGRGPVSCCRRGPAAMASRVFGLCPACQRRRRVDEARRSGASVLQDLVHRPEVTRVGFHQFVARAAASTTTSTSGSPRCCRSSANRCRIASRPQPWGTARTVFVAGPPVVDNQEVPHT